jgi:hypothetical protein
VSPSTTKEYRRQYDRRYKEVGPSRRRGDGLLDEIAIERVMRGRYPPARLTHQEVTAAVALGVRWRLTDGQIAKRLDLTSAAVYKRRQRAGIPAANPPYLNPVRWAS